jgi:hypothetical protein
MEIWKKVIGFDGYFASSLGRIKREERIVSVQTQKKGYCCVNMTNNAGIRRSHLLHRVVANTFLPNPDKLPQVNHIDGNKKNNNIENLEHCNNAYNYQHAKENGLLPIRKKGEQNPKAQLTNKEALEIRNTKISLNGRGGVSRMDLARRYGVTIHVIKDIRNGKSYSHI